ncbi:phage tail protein [Burkholderia sp. Nafp2/4-1b]|uniref:tail protein X n=1 Tax=Burkholderia sp. Nafp2/4-1b TaxID=2116686 RepID=UPI000EF94807|nr:tail protein X [Burkholderia sp. Nafp2/4-1b]RKU01830.1 phage tail protein [Burkholderia sp. Nafp2/4-1b]
MKPAVEYVRVHQGDTLDALCWRHYGSTAGTVEAVLEANPGLAELGPVLPMGTVVALPSRETIAPTRALLQLFD